MSHKLKLVLTMVLWGSIGIFSRKIGLSSPLFAFCRAIIGLPVVYIYVRKTGDSVLSHLKDKSLKWIITCGLLIGVNWCLLFYSIDNTTIANAIFSANMASIYVILLSPLVLGERLVKKQVITVFMGFVGLFLVVASAMSLGKGDIPGLVAGICSGFTYASVILINCKHRSSMNAPVKTFIQLLMIAVVLLPVIAVRQPIDELMSLDFYKITLMVIVGVVHTAIALMIYFSLFSKLSSATIAVCTYVDPVSAVLFGFLFFGEALTPLQITGGALILCSTLITADIK